MRKYIRNYPDKRRRKILSKLNPGYAKIFRRVIKAGFDEDIRAEVFAPRDGWQMFVFYLDGKKKQPQIIRAKNFTPYLFEQFKLGIKNGKLKRSPITYHRLGTPEGAAVIIVRRQSETGKNYAYADADKVYADIVKSFQKVRF